MLQLGVAVSTVLLVLHECQLIHCDLKPDNLFICRSGERVTLKILDLGMVSWPDNAEPIAGLRCTLRYASPGRSR